MKKILIALAVVFSFFGGALANSLLNIEVVIEDANIRETDDVAEKALETYREFLRGERTLGYGENKIDIDFITIPKGEPDRHYFAKYAFFDSDGDRLPELHVKSARYYYIFKYKDDDLIIWKLLSPYDELLNNGAFLWYRYQANGDWYNYYFLSPHGKNICGINFGVVYGYDKEQYIFCNIEVAKETWEALTARYLTIGSDKVEWVIIYEETT